ncbi:hypothetical protein A0257_14020 [Hymenobacter psoromatis]|nr:hypothetical protein A0257_14020 [Hymenobacter psoromatis]
MFTQPTSPTPSLGRYLLATPLAALLLFGTAPARAQVVPSPAPPMKSAPSNPTYYIDSKLSDATELTKIEPDAISYIQIIKGDKQRKLFGNTTTDGVAVITTKANAGSPAVLAFNKRINDVAPLTPATPAQNSAVAAIMAYMTKAYPAAKLEIVGPVEGQAGRYRAIFKQNGQRLQLLFDGQGQPVKE